MKKKNPLNRFIEKYRKKKVHIVGFSGAEGGAVTKMLHHFQFRNLTLHDNTPPEKLFEVYRTSHKDETAQEQEKSFRFLTTLPHTYHYAEEYLQDIEHADLIILPQAWYLYSSNKKIQSLAGNIPTMGMTEMYLNFSPCRTVGITGTNGKSTTARLMHEIFTKAEIPHYFAGNDRLNRQVLDKLETMKPEEYFLLEISNRQLLQIHTSPRIAVYTTITPDHIDEHGSFDEYVKTKKRLMQFQQKEDILILNHDDPILQGFATESRAKVYGYSASGKLPEKTEGIETEQKTAYLRKNGKRIKLFSQDELALKGEHNFANCLAVTLAALLEGVDIAAIRSVLQQTKGLRYRNQFVKTIRGIHYYNDLNSTVPEATIAALRSFPEQQNTFVILGGDDKGLDYTPLVQELQKKHIHPLLLPGSGTDKIVKTAEKIPSVKEKFRFFTCLDDVVRYTDKKGKKGDYVLLSPACAYFFSRFTNLVTEGDESWLNALTVKSP